MGLHSFKLSKLLVVVASVVVCGEIALAEDRDRDSGNSEQMIICTENKNFIKMYPDPNVLIDFCSGVVSGSRTNECTEAETAFSKAREEFYASCSAGGDSCYEEAYACSTCKGTGTMPSYCPGKESRRSRSSSRSRQTEVDTTSKKDSALIGVIKSCPAVGISRVDELKDEVEKHQEKKESLQDELNGLVEDLQTAEGEAKEAQAEYTSTLDDITNERDEAERKLKLDTETDLKAKRKEYDELNQQITEMTLKIQEINMQKIEAISAAESKCHNQALSELNVFLKDRRAALTASQLSAGSLKSLFGSTGPSRKQKNMSFASKYYNSCLQDKNHTDKIASIKRAHAMQLEQVNSAIQSARGSQMKLIQEISGEATQKKFSEALELIYKTHQRQTQKTAEAYYAKMQTNNAKIEGLKRKIATAQDRLKEETSQLTHKLAVYGAADEVSGGKGKDDDGSKFLEKYSTLASAADTLLSRCSTKCTGGTSENATCKAARKAACLDKTSADMTSGGQCEEDFGRYKDSLKSRSSK